MYREQNWSRRESPRGAGGARRGPHSKNCTLWRSDVQTGMLKMGSEAITGNVAVLYTLSPEKVTCDKVSGSNSQNGVRFKKQKTQKKLLKLPEGSLATSSRGAKGTRFSTQNPSVSKTF